MRFMTLSVGLLAAACPTSGFAASPPSEAQPANPAAAPVSSATAATLARVVAPLDLMVPMELEQARKAILALPAVDKDAKQLEAEYPGIYAALWTEVEPEMRRQAEADYPGYWAALEQIYVKRLTENEAHAVLRFFRSATGQKLIRNMYGSIDTSPLFAEMIRTDNYNVDEQQMKALTDTAKAKAVQQIGEQDHADLWILVASIKLEKFQALGAETQKATLDWVNKEDAEGDEKLSKFMEAAMVRYMDAHPPKK